MIRMKKHSELDISIFTYQKQVHCYSPSAVPLLNLTRSESALQGLPANHLQKYLTISDFERNANKANILTSKSITKFAFRFKII